MTLPEIIAELDDGSDLDDVAATVVKTVLSDFEDIAASLLLPYVRDQVRRQRRKAARQAEDAAFANGASGGHQEPAQALQEPGAPSGQADAPEPQMAAPEAGMAPPEPAAQEDYEAQAAEAQQPVSDPLAALRQLAAETFWVPGHGLVTWSDATAAQHEARAAWLQAKAGALTVAADRHAYAASVIKAAGVERLADVTGFQPVPV